MEADVTESEGEPCRGIMPDTISNSAALCDRHAAAEREILWQFLLEPLPRAPSSTTRWTTMAADDDQKIGGDAAALYDANWVDIDLKAQAPVMDFVRA